MLYGQFATQEEIDKEYDVEKSMPDFQRYVEFNINESKKARDELECLLDVPFGPTVEETLDIFPAQDPDAPILVFIHGGYWRSNSSKEFSWVARGPVALGFTVVITNYALCPKVTLPEITRQSRAAIAWVQRSHVSLLAPRSRGAAALDEGRQHESWHDWLGRRGSDVGCGVSQTRPRD
jgi:arylformamidase